MELLMELLMPRGWEWWTARRTARRTVPRMAWQTAWQMERLAVLLTA